MTDHDTIFVDDAWIAKLKECDLQLLNLLIPIGAIVYQQINLAMFLEFTINAEISGSEPWIGIQKRSDYPILEADYCILCRGLIYEPKTIDRVKTGLAKPALDHFPVN